MPLLQRLSLLLLATHLLAACDTEPPPNPPFRAVAGGDADRGKEWMVTYGCVACHDIEGVASTGGQTGPALRNWARRRMIAGVVPNEPDHLVQFVQEPQVIRPGSGMPNLGVTERDARDIAAYLYTLR